MILHGTAPLVFGDFPQAVAVVRTLAFVYMALVGMTVFDALLNAVSIIYGKFRIASKIQIKPIVQVLKIVVYCSVGDGTTQQGEFLEACAEASRRALPVLFLIEDNHWAISTPTAGKTLYSSTGETAREFHGVPIRRIDGRDVPLAATRFAAVLETRG